MWGTLAVLAPSLLPQRCHGSWITRISEDTGSDTEQFVWTLPPGFGGVFLATVLSLLLWDAVPALFPALVSSSLLVDGALLPAANTAAHVDDGALLRPSLGISTAIWLYHAHVHFALLTAVALLPAEVVFAAEYVRRR